MRIQTAMIMAAGLGTRLRPITEKIPKALLPIFNIPVIQFNLDTLVDAGIKNIVANVHHLAEQTREGILKLETGSANVRISDESEKLLGSAGGMARALPLLGNAPFFRTNADRLFEIDFQALETRHFELKEKQGVQLTLALYPSGEQAYTEILLDPKGELVTGIGRPVANRPYYMGVAVIEPSCIQNLDPNQPSDFVESILKPAIAEKKLGACLLPKKENATWIDLDSPKQWHRAHLEILERLEQKQFPKLWIRRIESQNRRIGPLIWVSQNVPLKANPPGWAGPAYLACTQAQKVPDPFGPRMVQYGEFTHLNSPSNGAVWAGSRLVD